MVAVGQGDLFRAAAKGLDATVRELLQSRASPNAVESTGASALHLAATAGHEGAVRLLLDHGADVYLAGNLVVKTPLSIARSLCPPGHARARTLYPAADLVIRRASSLAWAKLLAVLFAIKLVVCVRRARERVYMPGGRGARAAEASFERNMRQRARASRGTE